MPDREELDVLRDRVEAAEDTLERLSESTITASRIMIGSLSATVTTGLRMAKFNILRVTGAEVHGGVGSTSATGGEVHAVIVDGLAPSLVKSYLIVQIGDRYAAAQI